MTDTAAVDPRIRARRIAVVRAQGRRRLHILAVVAGVAVAAAAAWGISRTPLMDVDRIAVAGAAPAKTAEILESSALSTGLPMLYLDVDEVERSVASLPWVRSARVWRDWPGTVHIAVEPRLAAATVPGPGGRTALIDPHGYVIAWAPASGRADGPPGEPGFHGASEAVDVPHLAVPFGGQLGDLHTAADGPLAVAAAMPDDLHAWVTAVTIDPDTGSMGLDLVGGASVVLGEPTLLDDKISAVRALLWRTDLDCITGIDVTMPDIATVTRHQPCWF